MRTPKDNMHNIDTATASPDRGTARADFAVVSRAQGGDREGYGSW